MQRIYYVIYQKREDIGGYWPISCFILFGFFFFSFFGERLSRKQLIMRSKNKNKNKTNKTDKEDKTRPQLSSNLNQILR